MNNRHEDVQPWAIEWQPEQINRFWNWWGSNPALENHYFSKRNGDAVIAQVSRYVRLSGKVVDLGSGSGFLVEKLIKRGVDTLGVDISADSVESLNRRLEGRPHFLGARVSQMTAVPLENESANIVFLVETVEHLGDDVLSRVLAEAWRIAKQGGYVIVTTPNDETLDELKVMCPNCGCVFHTYQHMRSWTPALLREWTRQYHYREVVCRPTLFSSLPRWAWLFHRIAFRVLNRKLPHLLYIGQKVVRE